MKFKHGTRRRAAEYEKDWVQRWKNDQTFEKSVAQRPVDNAYVFYDGPPFITGVPHHGTLLSSIVKDAVPRYWTMKGKRVERRWGWDCHGLPAENFVEKQMNIMDRRQIMTSSDQPAPLDKDGNPLPTISLEKYITKARESMVANSETWQGVIDRIGRWVDFKGAYRTMDKDFMESVWWAFKQLYEAGKIYEGEKVLMYDTKFATPVSKAEVTMDNDAYQTVTDPSVYVKFKLISGNTRHKITLDKSSKILFVCNANVVRSQMAQAFYNHFTKTQNADSAGVNAEKYPTAKIPTVADFDAHLVAKNLDPLAVIDLMREKGIEVGASQRTQLTKDMLCDYDLVVNIANRNQTPDWLKGDNVVWWKIEDPHAESRELAELACDEIEKRVKQLISGEVVDDIEGDDVNVLAWTTTPWTLPANLMLAVNPDMTYCEMLVDGEKLIIAEEALERTLQDEKHQPLDYEVLRTFPGSELVGKKYQPLNTGSTWPENDKIHTIYAADFVSHESGTGIVHIAPAYGEDDFELGKANGIAPFHVIDDNGYYTDTNYKGLEVWENNKFIAKDLKEKEIVWKIEYIHHEYPFNPRSKQRIMYRAIPSWFFAIQGQKPLMLEQNENINWFPAHLKHGRFAKNIEQAPDWNLSRDRFWATAMPVWKGDRGTVKVVGSYAELKELSGVELDDYHRPWVDDITFEIDGETFTRIDKVLDCWFESGSMPFAQLHYPFENQAKFEQNYPADFIVEYIGQVRAWFYYVHAVNVALAEIDAFGEAGAQHKNAYSNVITTGVVAGNDGRKMSKSLGNFTDPNELMDKFSADSLRFLLLSSPLLNGEDFALHDKDVGDVARKLSMIWNMYDFFTMYAEVDEFTFPYDTASSDAFLVHRITNTAHSDTPESLSRTGTENSFQISVDIDKLSNPLDIWIISRLHELVAEVEKQMDAYNIPDALSPILPFLDDASNWYVRRSRRRFWKSEDDGDKNDAYRTLHYVLVRLSYILAPFTPFLAEELYHNLTGDDESIHLKDWLPAGEVNRAILRDMNALRAAVNDGLSKRAAEGIKVRQPLASAKLVSTISQNTPEEVTQFLVDIARDELNVKSVEAVTGSELDVPEASAQPSVVYDLTITPELKREGLMREIIRHVQSARKKAGLQVDDRIELGITSRDSEIAQAVDTFADTIKAETLAVKLGSAAADDMEKYDVKVDGKLVEIYLRKHN
ncbi:MAG: class I tRNA ligase family protein [Candidatus Nanosynbacter sp.]|nr:class I tRNA ligase family protein [Candidatus Nanosynbacter sp.]